MRRMASWAASLCFCLAVVAPSGFLCTVTEETRDRDHQFDRWNMETIETKYILILPLHCFPLYSALGKSKKDGSLASGLPPGVDSLVRLVVKLQDWSEGLARAEDGVPAVQVLLLLQYPGDRPVSYPRNRWRRDNSARMNITDNQTKYRRRNQRNEFDINKQKEKKGWARRQTIPHSLGPAPHHLRLSSSSSGPTLSQFPMTNHMPNGEKNKEKEEDKIRKSFQIPPNSPKNFDGETIRITGYLCWTCQSRYNRTLHPFLLNYVYGYICIIYIFACRKIRFVPIFMCLYMHFIYTLICIIVLHITPMRIYPYVRNHVKNGFTHPHQRPHCLEPRPGQQQWSRVVW